MAAPTPARAIAAPRRPAADLIAAVIDNMRENREELRYSVVVPSRYTVVLSPAEHARLEGLLPRLQAEAVRALDEELARMNRRSWLARRVGSWRRERPALENADASWFVEFIADLNGDLAQDGDILVHSELRLPAEPDLPGGERTRRISTVHAGTARAVQEQTVVTAAAATRRYARLTYADRTGTHHVDLVRDATTIGRGGSAFPVDIRVSASEDVSREHARIRREPTTGRVFLADLSRLGTTLDGRHIPRGIDDGDGQRRENGVEAELPHRARIGLAGVLFVDFERMD